MIESWDREEICERGVGMDNAALPPPVPPRRQKHPQRKPIAFLCALTEIVFVLTIGITSRKMLQSWVLRGCLGLAEDVDMASDHSALATENPIDRTLQARGKNRVVSRCCGCRQRAAVLVAGPSRT